MKRGMEPFLVLNRTISSKSVYSLGTWKSFQNCMTDILLRSTKPQIQNPDTKQSCMTKNDCHDKENLPITK